jgi:hypothetical protein
MTDANTTEDIARNGRRATDDKHPEGFISHQNHGLLRWLVNGITVGGVIGAIFLSGRASTAMDTALKNDDKQDIRIENLYVQNNKLLLALTEQNVQQRESDKRFESMFRDVIEGLEDVDDSVRENEKDIIIMQQKISAIDNTSVTVAMR